MDKAVTIGEFKHGQVDTVAKTSLAAEVPYSSRGFIAERGKLRAVATENVASLDINEGAWLNSWLSETIYGEIYTLSTRRISHIWKISEDFSRPEDQGKGRSKWLVAIPFRELPVRGFQEPLPTGTSFSRQFIDIQNRKTVRIFEIDVLNDENFTVISEVKNRRLRAIMRYDFDESSIENVKLNLTSYQYGVGREYIITSPDTTQVVRFDLSTTGWDDIVEQMKFTGGTLTPREDRRRTTYRYLDDVRNLIEFATSALSREHRLSGVFRNSGVLCDNVFDTYVSTSTRQGILFSGNLETQIADNTVNRIRPYAGGYGVQQIRDDQNELSDNISDSADIIEEDGIENGVQLEQYDEYFYKSQQYANFALPPHDIGGGVTSSESFPLTGNRNPFVHARRSSSSEGMHKINLTDYFNAGHPNVNQINFIFPINTIYIDEISEDISGTITLGRNEQYRNQRPRFLTEFKIAAGLIGGEGFEELKLEERSLDNVGDIGIHSRATLSHTTLDDVGIYMVAYWNPYINAVIVFLRRTSTTPFNLPAGYELVVPSFSYRCRTEDKYLLESGESEANIIYETEKQELIKTASYRKLLFFNEGNTLRIYDPVESSTSPISRFERFFGDVVIPSTDAIEEVLDGIVFINSFNPERPRVFFVTQSRESNAPFPNEIGILHNFGQYDFTNVKISSVGDYVVIFCKEIETDKPVALLLTVGENSQVYKIDINNFPFTSFSTPDNLLIVYRDGLRTVFDKLLSYDSPNIDSEFLGGFSNLGTDRAKVVDGLSVRLGLSKDAIAEILIAEDEGSYFNVFDLSSADAIRSRVLPIGRSTIGTQPTEIQDKKLYEIDAIKQLPKSLKDRFKYISFAIRIKGGRGELERFTYERMSYLNVATTRKF